jgi:hypothetical protein
MDRSRKWWYTRVSIHDSCSNVTILSCTQTALFCTACFSGVPLDAIPQRVSRKNPDQITTHAMHHKVV